MRHGARLLHFRPIAAKTIVDVDLRAKPFDHLRCPAHMVRVRMGNPHEREVVAAEVVAELLEQVRVMARALGAAGSTGPIPGVDQEMLPVG